MLQSIGTLTAQSNSGRCCSDGIMAHSASRSICVQHWIKSQSSWQLFPALANDTATLIATHDVAHLANNEPQVRQERSQDQQQQQLFKFEQQSYRLDDIGTLRQPKSEQAATHEGGK